MTLTREAIRAATTDLAPAALEDGFYYLRNFQTVLRWVIEHHDALLDETERRQLNNILALPCAAQALLVRMVMRRGKLFRSDKLSYTEIGPSDSALPILAGSQLVCLDPPLTGEQITLLCRRAELLTLLTHLDAGAPKHSASKSQLSERLRATLEHSPPLPLTSLWPQAGFQVVGLICTPLLDRVRLMFFGNLRQDWTEFVLAELGHQRYEQVDFSPTSRAFARREEVNGFLSIHQCQLALEDGQSWAEIAAQLPPPQANPWLEHRRRRLQFALGRATERAGELALASAFYGDNPQAEAKVRYFRLWEKRAEPGVLLAELHRLLPEVSAPEPQLHLQRIAQRLARRAGLPVAPLPSPPIAEQHYCLNAVPGQAVEWTLQQALSTEHRPVYYVENHLFPALLALLLWPVLFAPLPGAFFHPFQSGPADLFRPDFVARRRPEIDRRLALLQGNAYRGLILETYREKRGLSCRLVHWPVLDETLITLALDCIPAEQCLAVFKRLLGDLRNHCRGMPDLIQFDRHTRRYQLLEVKGPGDRLQDHQRLWMAFFHRQKMPVAVAHVSWRESKT